MKIFAAIVAILTTPALPADMTITSATGVQPSLSQQERNVLAAALSKADTGRVTVICGGAFCRALSDGVISLFMSAKWSVKTINHGGLGIDGVSGIRVNSCGMEGEKIAAVLRRATSRKIEMVDDGKCPAGSEREILLILGQPDF